MRTSDVSSSSGHRAGSAPLCARESTRADGDSTYDGRSVPFATSEFYRSRGQIVCVPSSGYAVELRIHRRAVLNDHSIVKSVSFGLRPGSGLSEEQIGAVEAVAMDMWEPYINSTLH